MKLVNVLTDSSFTELTDAECVNALDVEVEISRDNTSYLWGGLNLKLIAKGVDPNIVAVWDQLLPNLQGGSMLDKMLSSGGVDLTLDVVRVPIMAALGSDDTIDTLLYAMLDIGITIGKKWEAMGLDALPSEMDVAAARIEIQNMTEVSTIFNELLSPLRSDPNTTVADIKTAVAAWEV